MRALIAIVCSTVLVSGIEACNGSPTDNRTGTLGLGLQVSPNVSVSTATYTIDGPNGFTSAGTVAVGDSADVPVVVSHLPVADGYQMDVTATATDGMTVCEGSTPFDVRDNATSTVIVHLACALPSGDLSIESSINLCPMLDGLSVSPSALHAGGVASLSAEAHDTDHGPAPLSYAWTVNGVKLPNKTSPTLGFTCSSPGDVTITATVSDGDPNPSCADTLAVKVSCAVP